MIIRQGTENDMPEVLNLIRELAEFEREPEAVVINVNDLLRDGFSDVPLFQTFVAEIDGQVAGMALYYYRYSTWKGRTIHLEDLIVKKGMRGLGIGTALYNEIMKRAEADGVRRVEWNVLDWNTEAIRFYEKSGAKVLTDWRVVQFSRENL